MLFEWNPRKNAINIRKHGIDFNDVPGIFDKPLLTRPDENLDSEEERWIRIGLLFEFVCVVVYAEHDGEFIRIISARKATDSETILYAKTVKNR